MSTDASAALLDAPKPGDIIAGKYRVDRLLGAGGMGFVVAVTHVQLDETFALKMLLPQLAQQGETVARFLREGRAAVKIRNPHVCRIVDVGSDRGAHYMVMERLDGCDLEELLRREGKLSCAVAVDYVLQACEAIAEAHALHIVHRDLKPANLFLVHDAAGDPFIKVLDFGVSKVLAPESALHLSMTKTATMVGSPLYMSPEQLRSSKDVDQRADIWAIGVILYELIAGRRPFAAQTLPELGALVFASEAPDLRAAVPEVPVELARVVATCMSKNVDERFPSIAELAAALAPFGTSGAARSRDLIARTLDSSARPTWSRPPPRPSPGSESPSFALADTEPVARASRRRAIALPAGLALLVVAATTFGVVFVRRAHRDASALAPSLEEHVQPAAPTAPGPDAQVAPSAAPLVESSASSIRSVAAPDDRHAPRTRQPHVRPPPQETSARPVSAASSAPPVASSSTGFVKGRFQ